MTGTLTCATPCSWADQDTKYCTRNLNPHRPGFFHGQLLREVWGKHTTEHSPYLRIYAHQLRQKLEQNPLRPRYLLTESGVGYRLKDE